MEKNDEKLVFVTGASRGIGKAIANWFRVRGYCVAHGFLSNVEMASKPFRDSKNLSVRLNIQKQDSIEQAIKCAENHFKRQISILVNNAAISQEKDFANLTEHDWDQMMEVNLRGPFFFSQAVLKKMIEKKWGRIINISSVGGQWGGINQIHYACSKGALISLTMSLAKTYSKFNITCNAVSPGLVETDMTIRELQSKEGIKKIRENPIERVGSTEDIASMVGFLASDEAGYVTGQTINVNGGMYFGR